MFPFRLHINVKRRIVSCSYTLDIKTPMQLSTLRALHVMLLMYPWVSTTGNLPPEILVILTKRSFRGKRVIYHSKKSSV